MARPDPTCDPSYNSRLKDMLLETFVHFVIPENVLPMILRYNIITANDQDYIKAVTRSNGTSAGAEALLDRISRYHRWFDVLQDVLRDDSVKLVHVADQMNVIKEKAEERYTKKKCKKGGISFPFKVRKKYPSTLDENDILKKQIIELTRQCSLLNIQVDESKAEAMEAKELYENMKAENDQCKLEATELRQLYEKLDAELKSRQDIEERELKKLRIKNEELKEQLLLKEQYCAEREEEIVDIFADCSKLMEEVKSMSSIITQKDREIRHQQVIERKLRVTIESLKKTLELVTHKEENETHQRRSIHEGYVSLEEMLTMELCKLEKDMKDIELDDEIEVDEQVDASSVIPDTNTPPTLPFRHPYVNAGMLS
ncbi:M protein, serotype 5-like [Physella acuta]|uniref:M protein, serotype 5-like n=1 Tax=Physella acuta TaxID=109671 RepID=UPI0027DBAAB8|nr:M protein, serotype 5-like [Physella acuta]